MSRILICIGAVIVISGCAYPEVSKRQGDFTVRALEANRPDLALPPAKALSEELGEPKEKLPVTAENSEKLAKEKPKKGFINLFGKLIMGALTLAVTAAGGQGLLGKDC